MNLPVLAGALALLAALLVAVSAVAQQTAAASVVARGAGFFAALVRRPRWLLGMVADTMGFVALLGARAFGPLLLVQPLMASSVLFALLLGARGRRWEWTQPAWGVVLAAALAVFVSLGRPERGAVTRAPLGAWLPWLVVLGVVAAGALLAARRVSGAPRAVLTGIAAAVGYGLGAALTTTAVAVLPAGFGALVTTWETWAAAAALLAGTAAQQLAYRAAPLPASLPVVAAGEPVVAVVLGVVVFGESLAGGGPLVALAVAGMAVAVVVLARSRG